MQTNSLKRLRDFGQSLWLDFISRDLITSGQLKQLVEDDGLCGVTSNPSIFDKAISSGNAYDAQIVELVKDNRNTFEIMQALMIDDIRSAADVLRPLYDDTEGRDGFVSLEVSPHLAADTRATIEEARRLWKIVDRPNIFIKVPATSQGIPAIAQLISDGLNINITLLFGLSRYKEVTDAYLAGLEALDRSGKALDRVASVASFFLSRIDVMVDPMLEPFTKYENKNGSSPQSLSAR